jgi:IS30 family transposase
MAYSRLTDTDRETIMTMLAKEKSATEIAAALGRAVSTITRELHRHLYSNGLYSAISAQRQADMTARLHHTQR